VRDQVQVTRAADGESLWLQGRMTDITERKRAEEHARLQTSALEALADGVFLLEFGRPDFPLCFLNPALERLTGMTARQLLGRCWRLVLSAAQERDVLEEAEEAIRQQRAFGGEVSCKLYNGTRVWHALSLAPLQDRSGKLTHYLGTVRDVTERKELEAQRARFLQQQNRANGQTYTPTVSSLDPRTES
jgi:PAS domain S-box-containing protein